MKTCNCIDQTNGRLYKALFSKMDPYRLCQDELVARKDSLKELSVFICKKCILRAYVKPVSLGVVCLTAAILVLGIKPETNYIWMQYLLGAGRLVTGGILGMIGLVIISAAINTNYFITNTIILKVKEEYPDFGNSLHSGLIRLVERRKENDPVKLKMMVSVLLGMIAFWLIAPTAGVCLSELLF